MARFVLDTFAPYAYFTDEPAANIVQSLVAEAAAGEHEICIATVNLAELIHKLWRIGGRDLASDALYVVQSWPVEVVEVDLTFCIRAASIKAIRRVGYLDCFPTALAIERGAAILTGDSGFSAVEDLAAIFWLPRS